MVRTGRGRGGQGDEGQGREGVEKGGQGGELPATYSLTSRRLRVVLLGRAPFRSGRKKLRTVSEAPIANSKPDTEI
jgi:hypothetical protein